MRGKKIQDEILDIEKLHDSIQGLANINHVTTGDLVKANLGHNLIYNMRKFYPRVDNFYVLSRLLNTNMEALLTGKNMSLITDEKEADALNLFKKLNDDNKELIIKMIRNLISTQD